MIIRLLLFSLLCICLPLQSQDTFFSLNDPGALFEYEQETATLPATNLRAKRVEIFMSPINSSPALNSRKNINETPSEVPVPNGNLSSVMRPPGVSIAYLNQPTFSLSLRLANSELPPVSNVWMRVSASPGYATANTLTVQSEDQKILPQDGIYKLGTLAGWSNLFFNIEGYAPSNKPDTLTVIYGWACQSFTERTVSNDCSDTFSIVLSKQFSTLELIILEEPDLLDLCDTSSYYEFETYNAADGTIYGLHMNTILPSGLSVFPGSSAVSYPAGTPFVSTPDPILGGGVYDWNLSTLIPLIGINGLPGISNSPANAVKIRFRTIGTCNIVSNTQPYFGTYGVDALGIPTNQLIKPGAAIQVAGVSIPAPNISVAINSLSGGAAFCGGEQSYSVLAKLLDSSTGTDSIFVQFKGSLGFQSGSYVSLSNAADWMLTADGIKVSVPAGALAGTEISFTFSVVIQSTSSCSEAGISVQALTTGSALCATTGSFCQVLIASGTTYLKISIESPELMVTHSRLGMDEKLRVDVINNSLVPLNSSLANLFLDVNLNGIVDASDIFLSASANTISIPGGDTTTFSFSLPPGFTQYCRTIIQFSAEQNCLCADMNIRLSAIFSDTISVQACDISPLVLGVGENPGTDYQWNVTQGAVSCSTCSTTLVSPAGGIGSSTFARLTAAEPGCVFEVPYKVQWGYVYAIIASATEICEGEGVQLAAEPPGGLYAWSGPGAVGQSAQFLTVFPRNNAVYRVTVTMPGGCTGENSGIVLVSPSDTLDLLPVYTCVGEAAVVLGQLREIPGVYSRLFQKLNGCDSLIRQSLIHHPENKTNSVLALCSEQTAEVFDTIVSTSGLVCRTFSSATGCDSTHCITVEVLPFMQPMTTDTIFVSAGTPISLQGASGYTDYRWLSANVGCDTCQSVLFVEDSAGRYEYALLLTDTNGCTDSVLYRVIVRPRCNVMNVRMPNAFTPNEDGLNDVFKPIESGGSEVYGSLIIFNRWGEMVYESEEQPIWDGRILGENAPSEVYVFLLKIFCSGSIENLVGEVTLLR